jgi:hypothetical protein
MYIFIFFFVSVLVPVKLQSDIRVISLLSFGRWYDYIIWCFYCQIRFTYLVYFEVLWDISKLALIISNEIKECV